MAIYVFFALQRKYEEQEDSVLTQRY